MFGFDYLVAVVVLTVPPNSPHTAQPTQLSDSQRFVVQMLAVRWEIMDPREASYTLTRPEELQEDLTELRRRFRDLADAPPVYESLRFPDKASINGYLAFNRAYCRQLALRRPVELAHAAELDAALHEAEQLQDLWDTVKGARCEYYFVSYRRECLKKLREMMGDRAYYNGQLPPPVPLWRFQEID
ncbi:MAG TPA: hypothetical protein VG013_18740 [Gemmataceae bacterium]|jgi:hypothetical protein|nr:hypothetical protein [Gemmataceae bacterium]